VIFVRGLLLRLEWVAGPNYGSKQLIVFWVVFHLGRCRVQVPPTKSDNRYEAEVGLVLKGPSGQIRFVRQSGVVLFG